MQDSWGNFGYSSKEPPTSVAPEEIARILASESLTLKDVKTLMRGARYHRGYDEKFEYANTLLAERPTISDRMSYACLSWG